MCVVSMVILRPENNLAIGKQPSLAERLGYKATDRLLIINGDDAGMCHAANAATIDAFENGLMTSASIMVPCPWFPEIAIYAKAHPRADFGVHLTHTSEWKGYRWATTAERDLVPGLIDSQGYLWSKIEEVYAHASPRQVEIEARAQIGKALTVGIDVTHLDSHMGTLQLDPRYFEVYHRLAVAFDLPVRMASQDWLEAHGWGDQRTKLEVDGILFPDHLIHGGRKEGETDSGYWKRVLHNLRPGVTELYIHASQPSEETKHIMGQWWKDRAKEYRLFTSDEEIRKILDSQGVIRIGYRALRDLQRREHGSQK